jgi:GTP-binding protein
VRSGRIVVAKPTPIVAIVGRPNVGKSTLFNRLVRRRTAIVHADSGVTRDRSYGRCTWKGVEFRVVDTGGIVENPLDPMVQKMQDQVKAALDESSAILFLIDLRDGVLPADKVIAEQLRKLNKRVVLVGTKADNERMDLAGVDLYELGFGEPVAISAMHNRGMEALLDEIIRELPPVPERDQPAPVARVAIAGRPNVGKSSLVNALLGQERVIVDERPGTTRDAVDIMVTRNKRQYLFVDTAGLRRKARVKRTLEHYSVANALHSIRRCDLCIMLLDATGGIVEQDCRIGRFIKEQGKGTIIAVNKWDLVEDKKRFLHHLKEDVAVKLRFMPYAPLITISAVTKQRVFKLFDLIDAVFIEAQKRVSTSEFNDHLQRWLTSHPPPISARRKPRIYFGTQADVCPPTFILFTNERGLFDVSYLRYLENKIRSAFGFAGVPIRIELRNRR